MKITYIHHSSFSVETKQSILLFDYSGGTLPKLDAEKNLLVFVSHRHGDHFSEDIFKLKERYPNTRYILSNDIWRKRAPVDLLEDVYFVGPNEILKFEKDNIEIKTWKSTDEGVAFSVAEHDKNIYHAGDLNNWRWEGEEKSWNQNMEKLFLKELDKMKGERFDIAFLAVDPRLKQWFYLGLDQFMRKVGANKVFPMHFWGDFSICEKVRNLPCAEDYLDKIIEIHQEGEIFYVND